MKLLYISRYQFKKGDKEIYTLPAYGDFFWQKYLTVFSEIDVLGIGLKGYFDAESLSLITDKRVEVYILPDNTRPVDLKYDKKVKKELENHISKAEAVLVKPDSRRGIMAITIAKNYKVPYMIEMTGDFYQLLMNKKSMLMRLYSPIIYRNVLHAIKKCRYGLYVTEEYLQKQYPIEGMQCGCTDTFIPDPEEKILEKRIKKINQKEWKKKILLGLIGGYHDCGKGIDTAINALKLLKMDNIELHILGFGNGNDRQFWYRYAEERGVKQQLYFDEPISGIEDVLKWDDGIDIMILPSRSEGLPRCIIEALSRACPCIISNVCGMPELVNHRWLHNPGDFKTLADKIRDMVLNPENMEKAARENFYHSFTYKKERTDIIRNDFLNLFKEYAFTQIQIKGREIDEGINS